MSQRLKNFFSYHSNVNTPIRIVSFLYALSGIILVVVGLVALVGIVYVKIYFLSIIVIPFLVGGVLNIIISYGLSHLRKWVVYLLGIITVALLLMGNPYSVINLLVFIMVLAYHKRFEGGVSKKPFLIVIALIVIIVVGFFTWQYYKIIDTPSNEDKSSENVTSSDWITYRNDEFGFQYPQKFSIKEDNGKVLLFEIEYANNLRLSFEKNNKPLNKLVSRFNAEDVVIGNMESKFILFTENNQVNKNYYIYIDDISTFVIKGTVTEYGSVSFAKQSELLDKILSTFKFVK